MLSELRYFGSYFPGGEYKCDVKARFLNFVSNFEVRKTILS